MLLFYFDTFSFMPFFFILFGAIFIFIIFSNLKEWSKNNSSPVLTVPAKVVTKRTRTSGGAGDSSASTTYYATFEVQSGDRIELRLNGREYGQLADDDFGLLTFQGTRFHTFERHKKESSE
ncbi:hypothetical protein AEA09_15945 [Lysinibacillus contaminans]|uniref:DUF2500 domain-containing protein n=1 Tax=Lysinibacillus contaminans TaxID=1293441 RepID=A0ABR5JY15_9BACI|nr:DUF2500 domain-containing protein [Lysinibacillus contaminans]KOS66989.1 hypothetical protein AEA09_15945 [Lysinibacillus contaminans]